MLVYSGNFSLKNAGRFDAKYAAKYAEFGKICAEMCSKYAKYAAYIQSHAEIYEHMQIFAYAA